MDHGRQTSGSTAAGEVALLFTDVEGFSEMVDRLGDAEVYLVMRRHHAIIADALLRHGGSEVERQGDGALLAFDDPAAALRCAIDLQQAFAMHSARWPDRPLRVRMGLHLGRPLRDHGAYFGQALIVGARIMGLARGGEVLVSETISARLDGSGEFAFGPGRVVALKGLRDPHLVAEARWRHPMHEALPRLARSRTARAA